MCFFFLTDGINFSRQFNKPSDNFQESAVPFPNFKKSVEPFSNFQKSAVCNNYFPSDIGFLGKVLFYPTFRHGGKGGHPM